MEVPDAQGEAILEKVVAGVVPIAVASFALSARQRVIQSPVCELRKVPTTQQLAPVLKRLVVLTTV